MTGDWSRLTPAACGGATFAAWMEREGLRSAPLHLIGQALEARECRHPTQ